ATRTRLARARGTPWLDTQAHPPIRSTAAAYSDIFCSISRRRVPPRCRPPDALLHPSLSASRVPRPLAALGGVHAEAGPLAATRAHPTRLQRRDRAGRRGRRAGLSRARSGALAALELSEKRPLRQLADALTPRLGHRLSACSVGGGDAKKHLGCGAASGGNGAAREARVLATVRAPGAPALDDRLAGAAWPITKPWAFLGERRAVPMGVTGTGGGAAGGHQRHRAAP